MKKEKNNNIEKIGSFRIKNILLLNILFFYVVPVFIFILPTFIKVIVALCLALFFNPLYIIITNVIEGYNEKFNWKLPLIETVMDLPIILIMIIVPDCFNVIKILFLVLAFYIGLGYISSLLSYFVHMIISKVSNRKSEDIENEKKLDEELNAKIKIYKQNNTK